MVFEMTNSNKSVFIDRNTSHIKHGWQEKRMIMEYNACVSCALIGHNFPTVLQDVIMHAVDGRSLQYLCIQLNVNLQISTLFHGFSVKCLLTLCIHLHKTSIGYK